METDGDKDSPMSDFKVPSLPFKAPASISEPAKSKSDDQTVPDLESKEDLIDVNQGATVEPQPPAAPAAPAVQYEEPSWGGEPPSDRHYSLEILKNGAIVDTVKLTGKSFFTVGRLPVCDVPFEHPSLSRYHAVLQYKVKPSPEKPCGFYLFDLDSTHGSLHNKKKCFPKTFYRLRVGHMLKFGGSTRTVMKFLIAFFYLQSFFSR